MEPVDYIVIIVILAVLGGAGWYIHRARRKGQKCVGCPYAKSGCCSCKK